MIRNRAKLRAIFMAAFFLGMHAETPARADPISGAIAAIAAITWVDVAIFAAKVAATIALSYAAQSLAGKPPQANLGISGKLAGGGDVPRSFIVGLYCTAGSLVYANSWTISGQAPNAYLTQVVAVSDLPVTGLSAVWVNGVRYVPSGTAVAHGTPIVAFRKSGVDYLWVKFYDGTQVAADSFLTSTFGSHPTRPWTANHKGIGVAYAIVTARLKPDDPSFSGFPAFKFEVQGIKQYDPRLDSTNGGSGAHRWNNPATWAFTLNPAQTNYNILRGITYGGSWFYGLQNIAAVRLPTASWFAAMNECDLTITNSLGGSEAQYRCGAEVPVSVAPIDVIPEFNKACNGRVAEIAGSYKMRVGATGAAVMSLTDADIIVTSEQTFTSVASIGSLINAMTATYPEPVEAWGMKDAPARYDAALETEDGGRRLLSDVVYGTVPYADQVQRLMTAAVSEARKFRGHAFILPPNYWPCEPLDVLNYTSTRNGYSNKKFEIKSITDLGNLDVAVVIGETDASDYTFVPGDYLSQYTTVPTLELPGAFTISSGFAVSGVTISGTGGRAVAGIRISWGTGVEDVNGVRYIIRRDVDDVVVLTGETDHFSAGHVDVSENIRSATAYEVQAQYRPISIRESTWTGWLPVTTPDVRIIDLDIAIAAIVNAALADLAVTAQKIASGAITLAKHAAGLEPVSIVAGGLPSPSGYAGAKVVLNEADGKIYRYVAGAFTSVVPAVDISGTLVAAQLAAGAVTVDKLNAALQLGGGNIAHNSSFESDDVSTWWEGYGGAGVLIRSGPSSGFNPHGSWFAYNTASAGENGVGFKFKTGNVALAQNRDYVISWFGIPAVNTNAAGGTAGFDWNGAPPDVYTWLLSPVLVAGSWVRWAIRAKWMTTTAPTGNWAVSYSAGGGLAYGIGFDGIQVEVGEFPSAYAPKPDEILPGTVGPTEIADNAVTTPKLIAEAVVAAKVATGTLTATQIAASTITGGKIAASTITGGNIAASTITGGNIAAVTITAGNIAANTITGSQVAADTLTAGNIAAGAINTSELAAASVVAGKVAASAIGSTEIAADAIVASKIAADQIFAVHITALSITTAKINDVSVTAAKIVDGAVSIRSMSTSTYDSTDADVSSWTNIKSAAIYSQGGAIQVTVQIDRAPGDTYANIPSYDYRLYEVGSINGPLGNTKNSGDTSVGSAIVFSHTPGAGSHTYYVQINRNTAGSPYDDDTYHIPVTLNILEIYR